MCGSYRRNNLHWFIPFPLPQVIERELRTKEKDYRQFMREVSGSVTPELPSPSTITSPKRVRFFDENTLERKQRMSEIKKTLPAGDQAVVGVEIPELDEVAALFSSSNAHEVPSVGTQPPNHHAVDSKQLSLDTISETGLMQLDERSSLSSSISQLTISTPLHTSEEHYQLSVLWNGIWTTLNHLRRKIESVQEAWKAFEAKREAFARFLSESEGTTSHFYATLAGAKDFLAIDSEFTAHKVRYSMNTGIIHQIRVHLTIKY